MLVGAAMGFWAVQRIGGPGGLALFLAILVAAAAGTAVALVLAFLVITLRASQIVSGLALTIFAGAAGLSSYLGSDLNLADSPARHAFKPVDAFGIADPAARRPGHLRPDLARLRVVGLRGARRVLPLAHPSRAQRARRRGIAAGGGCDGNQRGRLPVRAHPGGRSVRGHRRRVLQPGTHAAMGRTVSRAVPAGLRSPSSSSRSGGPSSVSSARTSSARFRHCRSRSRPGASRSRRRCSRRCPT